jgi:hypothetical protein
MTCFSIETKIRGIRNSVWLKIKNYLGLFNTKRTNQPKPFTGKSIKGTHRSISNKMKFKGHNFVKDEKTLMGYFIVLFVFGLVRTALLGPTMIATGLFFLKKKKLLLLSS